MIISHKHRYLFVEVPRTGSTAISAELCEHYAGESILKKHAYYSTFLRQASNDEKTYRVISGVRNPLDDAVSNYRKLATRPRDYYSASRRNLKRYDHIHRDSLTFSDYFRTYYRYPFDHWTSTYHRQFAKVVRFERLKEDFAEAIDMLGLSLVRPLPQKNKTNRKSDFASYYSAEDIKHAVWVFGPYMRDWGYQFPDEWPQAEVPTSSAILYKAMAGMRKVYWNDIRQSDNVVGRAFRKAFLN